jgi:aldose 1-epimerase
MYTGNFLNHTGRGGEYRKHSAVCFETQYFPDSVHHDNFASPILKAGETYHTVTEYRFSLK